MLKRQKRRYIVVHVTSDSRVDQKDFLAAVWKAVEKLYGEYGASKTGLALIDFEDEKKRATLRVMNAGIVIVRAALASVTRIGDTPVSLRVLRVSGTIKSLRNKIDT